MTITRRTKPGNEPRVLNLPFEGLSSLQPGDSVRFFLNGWRYGTLDTIEKKGARILYAGHVKVVPITDVEKYSPSAAAPAANKPAARATAGRTRSQSG